MGNYMDLTGQKYNHLTALRHISYDEKRGTLWWCRCDCGKELVVSAGNLRGGKQKSCGCTRTAFLKDYNTRTKTTHGASQKNAPNGNDYRLYKVWCGIKFRCENPNSHEYDNYGGRGIQICDEWLGPNGFQNFSKWAYANGYDEKAPHGECTIDRIDNNGPYAPDNCRWVNIKAQSNNKRTNRYFTIGAETHTLAEWSAIYDVSRKLVRDRLSRGWAIERALTVPPIRSGSK